MPLLQTAVACAPPLHILPHPPQLTVSVFVFTHEFVQFCVPLGQLEMHLLAEQTWFAPQALPQAPQFAGSTSVRMQAPPHLA
jgi:hypothetical protein